MARSPANTPEGILAWAFALTTSVFQSQMPETSQLCTNTWDFRNILKNVWKNYFLIIIKKKRESLDCHITHVLANLYLQMHAKTKLAQFSEQYFLCAFSLAQLTSSIQQNLLKCG